MPTFSKIVQYTCRSVDHFVKKRIARARAMDETRPSSKILHDIFASVLAFDWEIEQF